MNTAYYSAEQLQALIQQGVFIPQPQTVAVGADVPPEALRPGSVLHPFSRIEGAKTYLGPGAEVGVAGPVTVQNSFVGAGSKLGTLGGVTLKDCTAGPGTVLGQGVAEQAVFLGKEVTDPDFTCGYGFRVRKGSLYEEDANSAQHTDTKMTILQPWGTLGSNLNFCDILLGGGSGPELGAFSEVGSGVIHFNFTARGDKATASLLGDVVQGVFLNQQRLFVGGQCGLVGPLTADYGTLTSAGGRYTGHLHAGLNGGQPQPPDKRGFDLSVFGTIARVVRSQVAYIAQLRALEAWYAEVRLPLAATDPNHRQERETVYKAGLAQVQLNLKERVNQLAGYAVRVAKSVEKLHPTEPSSSRVVEQQSFVDAWPKLEAALLTSHPVPAPQALSQGLLAAAEQAARQSTQPWRYTQMVQGITEEARTAGVAWLQGIAQQTSTHAINASGLGWLR